MSITAECPDCYSTYDLPDKYAGKKIRCRSCGGAIRVGSRSPGFGQEPPSSTGNWNPPPRTPSRPRATRRASRSGWEMPAAAFWLTLIGVVGFLLVGLAISVSSPDSGLSMGFAMFVAAALALGAAKIMLVVAGFQEEVSQGLLVLLVPFYSLIYLLSRQPRTKLAGQIVTIGLIAVVGSPVVILTAGFFGGLEGAKAAAGRDLAEKKELVENNDLQDAPGQAAPADVQEPQANPPETRNRTENRIARHERPELPPETFTHYLANINDFFAVNADHAGEIEKSLLDRDGYVPGSAKLDLDAGTFTFEASPRSPAANAAGGFLFGLGFQSQESPPTVPWENPTVPKPVTYTIAGTNPQLLRQYQAHLDKAAEMAITRYGETGYVAGSADVDLEGKTVTMECYPSYDEIIILGALRMIGLKVEERRKIF